MRRIVNGNYVDEHRLKIHTKSLIQKFTYTLQNLLNVNYFNKIRGIIIQNAYYLFSTDLNKIFHMKDVYM